MKRFSVPNGPTVSWEWSPKGTEVWRPSPPEAIEVRTVSPLRATSGEVHFGPIEAPRPALGRTENLGSLVVIEHNLDVVRGAERVIDRGPEKGAQAGEVVTTGMPELLGNDRHASYSP